MPFKKLSELPENIRKLSEKKQRQFMAVFNSAMEDCEGDDCESSAFAQANAAIKDDKKAQEDAPNYRESGEAKLTCATCEFNHNGWCTIYDFIVNQKWVCDSWQPSPYVFTSVSHFEKAGSRHSKRDNDMLQDIHDKAVGLGASCESKEEKVIEDNSLKAISETEDELRVANYIVLFNGRDLEGVLSTRKNQDGSAGEYFTSETQLESEFTKSGLLDIDWEHGRRAKSDGLGRNDILGFVDWTTHKIDEMGVWVERVLDRRNKYVKYIEQLIKKGLIGTSSEPIQEGVQKSADGQIISWPLFRDSLTVNPMEPRMIGENSLEALKALNIINETEVTRLRLKGKQLGV